MLARVPSERYGGEANRWMEEVGSDGEVLCDENLQGQAESCFVMASARSNLRLYAARPQRS